MTDESQSVTHLIRRVRLNDASAADALCRQFFARLARFADVRLAGIRRHVEGDDIALSCLDLLCRKLGDGRYPDLASRSELWSLLVRMAEQKAIDRRKLLTARKRGGGQVRGESVYLSGRGIDAGNPDRLNQPTEEDLVDLQDAFETLMQRLPGDELRETVRARLSGESHEAIAERLGISRRAVQMRLQSIAEDWDEALR